jgi:hypothetical protein
MSELRFVAPDLRRLDEVEAEVVACGVFRDVRPLSGLAGLVDWRLAGRLSRLARASFLVGEIGEALVLPARPRLPFDKVLVFGLGPRQTFGEAAFRTVLSRALDTLSGLQVKTTVIELPGRAADAVSAEHAAEVLLDLVDEERRDALTLVEDAEGQRRLDAAAGDRRRSSLRAQALAPR